MKTGIKIILIVASFLILLVLVALLGAGSNGSSVGGPIGIALLLAFLAGSRAIWKYNPDKKEENKSDKNDRHKLDKL